jgi:hypothetical protein
MLIYLVAYYFHQLELQLLNMPYRIKDFVTCKRRKTTIIRKTVKLPDYLITSTIHVLSQIGKDC